MDKISGHCGAIERVLRWGTATGEDDGRLVERFVSHRDEAAFSALVDRHGPMVLGVCRRALRDDRDVEDAFQATFLILARSAGTIRGGVGPWLHGVARRVALRARAERARRYVREGSSFDVEPSADDPPGREAERGELWSILDDELGRLPERLRAPIVLCHLEGLTHDQAALALRQPVGTIRSRLSRGRDRLRDRLARRGVSADDAARASIALAGPVPAPLLEATVRSALAYAVIPTNALAAAGAVALAQGALETMLFPNAKLAALALGTILTVGGASGYALQGGLAGAPAEAPQEQGSQPSATPGRTDGVETAMGPAPSGPDSELEARIRKYLARLGKELKSRQDAEELAKAEMEEAVALFNARLAAMASELSRNWESLDGGDGADTQGANNQDTPWTDLIAAKKDLNSKAYRRSVLKKEIESLTDTRRLFEGELREITGEPRQGPKASGEQLANPTGVPQDREEIADRRPSSVPEDVRVDIEGLERSLPGLKARRDVVERDYAKVMESLEWLRRQAGTQDGPAAYKRKARARSSSAPVPALQPNPTGMPPGPAIDPSPPRYLASPKMIVVTSEEGRVVTGYSSETGEARSLRLAEKGGAEITVSPILGIMAAALDLKGEAVGRIAVFSVTDGEWHPYDLVEPTKSASPVLGQAAAAYKIGRRIYAFSFVANGWDVLELREEGEGVVEAYPETLQYQEGDQLHVFSGKTGKWATLDMSKATGGPPFRHFSTPAAAASPAR